MRGFPGAFAGYAPSVCCFLECCGVACECRPEGQERGKPQEAQTRRKAVMIDVLGISGYELVPICELVGVLEGDWLKRDEVQ